MASILPLVALFQVFDGLSAVTAGILRARGKQVCRPSEFWSLASLNVPTIVYGSPFEPQVGVLSWGLSLRFRAGILLTCDHFSAYYIIGIPFGIWLTFKRDMELQGLWIGLTVSLVYCAVVGVWLCLVTDWDREVQKVMDRLARDKHHAPDDAERNGHGHSTALAH